jgi:cyclopropane fatty-acyl-phospholipid synthase-like methyltransferase
VLEIGSGTGQHAVYFAPELPHLVWQTADVAQHHAGIRVWLEEAALPNVLPPLALDVNQPDWPVERYDAVFSANTLHIMGWPEVEKFFAGVGAVLEPGGVLAVYGPFNYNGAFTSDSNARFDAWLKSRDPASGVRDFEAVDALARAQGLVLQQDVAMPSNNRTLVWQRIK